MSLAFRVVVVLGLVASAVFFVTVLGQDDQQTKTVAVAVTTTTTAVSSGKAGDPVQVCAASIPPNVISLARQLDAMVVCRPAATGQPGHVETTTGRIVIEARAGLSPAAYADTAMRLAQQLEDERAGLLS